MTKPPRPSRKGQELKPAAVRKRHNVAFRVNDEVRSRLQASADAAQRSVSEEIEFQLQRAFTIGPLIESMFPDRRAADMLRQMGEVVGMVRRVAARRQFDEIETRKAIGAAIDAVRDEFCLVGDEAERPDEIGSASASPRSVTEYGPAAMGYRLAEQHLSYSRIAPAFGADNGEDDADNGDDIEPYWTA